MNTIVIHIIAVAVSICMLLSGTISQIIAPGQQIEGIWLIWEGGSIAPSVLQFFIDGTGIGYEMVIDDHEYQKTLIKNKSPISVAYLESQISFSWEIIHLHEGENGIPDVLCIHYSDSTNAYYLLSFNFERVFDAITMVMSLQNCNQEGFRELGGSGYLKVNGIIGNTE